jgi:hypothetical protein
MDAADEGASLIEATTAVLQEHTGRCGIDDTPWGMALETGQQALACLWGERRDGMGEVMRLDRKYRKLLVTAPVAAGMTGDLGWVTLPDALPKGVNARLQVLVLLVGL